MSDTVQSRDAEFLIANLELEFELSHRKQSPLKISNRKYFAIFLSHCRAFPLPLHLGRAILIATFTQLDLG